VSPRALLAALALVCGAIAPAHAHSLSVAHVDVVVAATDPRAATVEVDLALRDLALTVPLDADRDEAVTWGELVAARPAIEALVHDHVVLASTGGACLLVPTGLATRRYDTGAYATLQLDARCPDADGWTLEETLFRDRDPQHRALATLHRDGATATAIAGGTLGPVALRVDGDPVVVPFVREGLRHLLVGTDHLAFLLSLVLPALLAWNGRAWTGAEAIGPRLRDTVWLVTAFTLAHSLTLTLAALGAVTPASRVVEPAIAASVLLAALNNVRPVVANRLWLLSLGFGLVHGFGFAGALGELGLPRTHRVLALFGFNLGVELGQLAVLAVVLPVLAWVRHRPAYGRRVVPGLSVAIAAVAASWLVQRLGGP
jgi:hypothetical protein